MLAEGEGHSPMHEYTSLTLCKHLSTCCTSSCAAQELSCLS